VYLHWRTREELFFAVFEREVREALSALLRAVQHDPQGFLLHRVARTYFLAIMSRPLLRGLLLADDELLGKLARSDVAREDRHRLMSRTYFELLAEHGLLHADLSPEAATYAFLATLEGFLRADAGGAEPTAADLRWRADLLAGTVQRAFEAKRKLPPATRDALARRAADLLGDLVDAGQPVPAAGAAGAAG
jgi:AcrR family transcriptional regulator